MMDARIEAVAADRRARRMDRRGFFGRLMAIVGGSALAHQGLETGVGVAPLLSPDPPQEVGGEALPVKYPGAGATLDGYLSRPQANGPSPAVIVIHQGAGLNDPMRNVARRLAAEGFAALAVDLLSRQGGTASFATPAEAAKAVATLAEDQIVPDLHAAFRYLQSNSSVRPERIAVLGFCWGGQQAFRYAAANPDLKAAVVFNGSAPPAAKLQEIQCPVLANYNETGTHAYVPETEELMKKYGKRFDPKIYSGAADTFCSDAGPNYNEAAAQDAWARTLAFLRENLDRGPRASA